MNSNNNIEEDLKFIPLNLQDPFSPRNSDWIPMINVNGDNNSLDTRNVESINFNPPNLGLGINSNPLDLPPVKLQNNTELFSLNTPSYIDINANKRYLAQSEPAHMEVLREYDFSIDSIDSIRGNKKNEVDKIYEKIKENHIGVFNTLKTYRIPSAIVSLIVKKIIYLAIKYSN